MTATAAIAGRALELSMQVADRWQERREGLAGDLAALGREEDPEGLERLLGVLDADRAALLEENAAVAQQQQALSMELEALREYAYLAECLQAAFDEPELADVLRSRREQIAAQVAIAEQGSAGLRLIVAGNAATIAQIAGATRAAIDRLKRRALGS